MSLAKLMEEDRRLAILRLLESQQGYHLNDSVVQDALSRLGHAVSRDQVRTDFAWLDEVGLLSVEVVLDRVHIAKLTSRGVDVAKGLATVPGVKRPRPGD
jgi:polyribonucleotide nucleotidyltransferase